MAVDTYAPGGLCFLIRQLAAGDAHRPPWIVAVTEYLLAADESGTHAQAVGTLLAGYLAGERQWQAFRGPWHRAHKLARLNKPFHLTNFLTPNHPDYRHLTDKEKRRLIGTIVSGICCARRMGFIAAVQRQKYDAILLPEVKKAIRDPYIFCFHLFLRGVVHWAERTLPRGDKIYCVFGEKRDMEQFAHGVYLDVKKRGDPHEYLAPRCLFWPVRQAPELVAADVLANRAGHFFRRPGLRVAQAEDPIIYRLLANRHLKHQWNYYDGERLEKWQEEVIELGAIPKLRGLTLEGLRERLTKRA